MSSCGPALPVAQRVRASVWLTLVFAVTSATCATPSPSGTNSELLESFAVKLNAADVEAIRAARAHWNAAVAARDIDALTKLFAADVHVATGAGNANGLEEAVGGLRDLLESRPDMMYERMPARIEGHEGYQLAFESGTWVERWTNKEDGRFTDLRGEYMVMWRKVGGVWLTKAEVYVPASCTGSNYCKPRPRR